MSVVTTRVLGRIGIVTIDNPPVSIGNAALRRDLYDAFRVVESNLDVDAILIDSAQRNFYAGSDIREFDGEIASPSLPDVIGIVEQSDKPVVAALNGLALGGGLELALACDARIAAVDAKLGLPEVTLGVVPGAGGTVRLPRLIGVPRAVEMIATGKLVGAGDAYDWGLVDDVVDSDDLTAAAIRHASTASKRRARFLAAPASTAEDVRLAVEKGTRNGKARPNINRAVDLVCSAARSDSESALKRERDLFDELRVGAEARNLRYLFFAKRVAAKDLSGVARSARVKIVGIAGAGTMGSKIAAAFLRAGIDVWLYELSSTTLSNASAALREVGGGGRLTAIQRIDDLASADIVIDAVFEDAQVKRDLLAEFDRVLAPETIIASNTSYLDLDDLGSTLADPSRFVGLHFFNPADRNPLLEVVQTRLTGATALATAAGVAKVLGKTPIVAGVADGFVANRVYSDYRSQAEFLVEEGASPREVDDAMRALGLPIGPFAVADMSGLDIAWARRKRLAPTRPPGQRYVTIADTLCEAGRLGKKTGAGWYRYTEDAPRGADDPVVMQIISEARQAKNIHPVSFAPEDIQRRLVCAMLVAAADLVGSGIANRASDIDIALTEGFAFPRHLGGPARFAAMQPRSWVLDGLRQVYESDPIVYGRAASAAGGDLPSQVEALLGAVGD